MHKGTRDLRVPSVACQASRVSAMNWPEFVKGDLEKNHVGIIPAFRTTTEKKTLSSKTKKTNNTLTHLTSSRLAIIITVQIIRSKEENKILPFTQASEADKDPNSCVQCLPLFNRSQSWASYCCYTSGPTSPTTLNTSNCIFFLFSADPGNRSEAKRSPVGSSWCESRPSFISAH